MSALIISFGVFAHILLCVILFRAVRNAARYDREAMRRARITSRVLTGVKNNLPHLPTKL